NELMKNKNFRYWVGRRAMKLNDRRVSRGIPFPTGFFQTQESALCDESTAIFLQTTHSRRLIEGLRLYSVKDSLK
ncbi:MAG TPA: hypothetical protein PLW66_05255, partial [Saprospiraceae bacterium]|nr:hypothetical protein [Saprospiraceae bacterium]